jgi:hypothetical protein
MSLPKKNRSVCISLCFKRLTKNQGFFSEFCPPTPTFCKTYVLEKPAMRWIHISLSLASRGDEPAEAVSLGATADFSCCEVKNPEDFSI